MDAIKQAAREELQRQIEAKAHLLTLTTCVYTELAANRFKDFWKD